MACFHTSAVGAWVRRIENEKCGPCGASSTRGCGRPLRMKWTV